MHSLIFTILVQSNYVLIKHNFQDNTDITFHELTVQQHEHEQSFSLHTSLKLTAHIQLQHNSHLQQNLK